MKISKFLCILLMCTSMFLSCKSEEKQEDKKNNKKTESLIEIKKGIYTEYYPGRKAVKIRGAVDGNKLREGKWTLYAKNGEEMSVTSYIHGKKHGASFVKYPTGVMNYVGEYKEDVKVGVWTFFDEKGEVVLEKDFGGL